MGKMADMTNEEYQRYPAVSKGTLDMAATDLYKPEWARKCPQDQDKIKTFDFGDAMHAITLEPDRLASDFIMAPVFNRRTNAGKEEEAAFYAENEGKKILTAEEHKKLNLMFESVMAHKEARALIEADGEAESSWVWTDSEAGLNCKCRPDKMIGSLLVDVKTTAKISDFAYSVEDFRYHVQDAWYCDGVMECGVDLAHMKFLVIQKTIEIGRYPVQVFRLPEEIIEYGRVTYRQDLNRYADFLDSGGEAETKELPIHYRFMDRALDATTEVTI
jgi:exodeoxyribonuclease VIII